MATASIIVDHRLFDREKIELPAGTAGGLHGDIQFNANGLLAGATLPSLFQWDGVTDTLVIESDKANGAAVSSFNSCDSLTGSQFDQNRSRGTLAAPTALHNGDYLGGFFLNGYDGANYAGAGGFDCFVDGSYSVGAMLVATEFYCDSLGGVALTLRGDKNIEVSGRGIFAGAVSPGQYTSGTRPTWSSGLIGQVIFNTTTNKLNVAGGAAWEAVTSV